MDSGLDFCFQFVSHSDLVVVLWAVIREADHVSGLATVTRSAVVTRDPFGLAFVGHGWAHDTLCSLWGCERAFMIPRQDYRSAKA